MLTPEQWDKVAKQAKQIYGDLELEIIQEIAERIANMGYANTVVINDALIAQEMGMLYQDVIELVAKYNDTSVSQIEEIFETAGVKSLNFDDSIYKEAGLKPIPIKQSKSMLQLLQATAIKTNANLNNLVMTTANTSQTTFYNSINKAYLEVSTGVKSYSVAIMDAIDEVSKNGAIVEYPSGYKTSIESACRMNIVTGVNQTCGKLQLMRADEMGWDLMELTAHSGARPEHAEWQGKIVSRSGRKGYLSFSDISYGEVDGFKGVNCRHDWYPYYEGSTRTYTQEMLNKYKNQKVTYNGKEMSLYEANQIQRKLERQIRSDKKSIAGLNGILTSNTQDSKIIEDTRNKLLDKQVLLKEHNSVLNDFVRQTGNRKDNSRLFVGKQVTNSNNNTIIQPKKTIKTAKTFNVQQTQKIPKNIDEFYKYYKNKTNKVLTPENLNKVLKYDEKPTIVPKKEFEKLAINNKYGVLERGFKTGKGTLNIDQIIDNYKHGDFYVGEGIYGSGTYTAFGKEAHNIAMKYAIDEEKIGNPNNIAQFLLKEDANVIEYSKLRQMRDEELNKLIKDNGFKDYFDVIENGFNNIKTTEISKYIMEMQDAGVYASIKGYDAIEVIQKEDVISEGFKYIVILNRKKMIMYD